MLSLAWFSFRPKDNSLNYIDLNKHKDCQHLDTPDIKSQEFSDGKTTFLFADSSRKSLRK